MEDVNERSKDGGAFVRFSFVPPTPAYADGAAVEGTQDEERVLQIIEKESRDAVSSRGYKPWFTWGESRAFLVKVSATWGGAWELELIRRGSQGKPWMEDMNRFPSSTIRVEFEGPEVRSSPRSPAIPF